MWLFSYGLLFVVVNSFLVSAQVSPAALNALEELYNSTNGANWEVNYNWMSSFSPCDDFNGWYGVYCNSFDQIRYLGLSYNRLRGTLPSSIFTNLTSLLELQLDSNSISGTLPDSIGYTPIENYIFLDFNELTGNIPDTFVAQPPDSDNFDTDFNYPSLWLQYNQLTGTLPPSFSVVNEYGSYELYDNYLLCPFPDYCDECCAGDCGECYQPVEQVEIDSLTSFYKDTNGPQWKQSTNWLNGNPCGNLQWFGVECGYDHKKHEQHIGSLNLGNNGLQGQVILDSLSGLTQLDLSQNDFDPSPLPDLSDSPQLKLLDLSQNKFTGTIPSSFENLLLLDTLNLSSNSLTGVLPRSVCGSYYLNLTGNDWTCPLPPCCDQATPPGNEPCGSCS